MLYMPVTNDANDAFASLRQPEIRPVNIIRMHSLAHCAMGAGDGAWLGRQWCDGRAVVIPTIGTAAAVFRTSERHITRIKPNPSTSLALGLLAYGWRQSLEFERLAFVAAYGSEILAALDQVTAPIPTTTAPLAQSDDDAEYAQWLNGLEKHRLDN